MKKALLNLPLILLFLSLQTAIYAQTKPQQFGRYFAFEFLSKDRWLNAVMPNTLLAHDTSVYQALDRVKNPSNEMNIDTKPVSPILLGIKLNPFLTGYFTPPIKSMSKLFTGYIISDGSEALVIAAGINKDNYKDFEYRVVENDSNEVIPWSKISRLEQNYGAKTPYGFIGKFKAVGKQLLVEVKNIRNYSIREGVIFDWRKSYKPRITQMLISTPQDNPKRRNFFNILTTKDNRGLATKFDPITNLPLDLAFYKDSVDNIHIDFKEHTSIAYNVFIIKSTTLSKDTTLVSSIVTENSLDIRKGNYYYPGKYELVIQRVGDLGQWPDDQVLRIRFEVLSPPYSGRKIPLFTILNYGFLILTFCSLIGFGYYQRGKEKLKRAARNQQLANLKLKSIRSQLNPHFMFNALTSIQNLINKNNISDANFYLSKFAGLTRQVLDSNNENFLSLEDEVKMLTDYLQMEQLRFDFQYQINVDSSLNQANIEVPAMLLQPFVENAVKHGVSGLKHNGIVKINFKAVGMNLEMSVTDNGSGYQQDAPSLGYGIKLSEERVELLNQLYKDQSISLTINSTPSGTIIMINLSNWIS
jgi:two-component system LytT family sensor kinase